VTGALKLSVIVPAYQEGAFIYDNLQRLLRELDQLGDDYEVIVVSDGSRDQTVSEVDRLSSQRVKLIAHSVNRGKGFALTSGAAAAHGDLIAFIDADMELDPSDIRSFVAAMREGDYEIVVGSKRHPRSHVSYPAIRRLQSVVYQLLIRVLFNLGVSDTQTGLKLFRREVLDDIVPLLVVKRFAFDLELLAVAHHFGYGKIAEAPISLHYKFHSTTNLRAVYRVLYDTAAIFYRLRILRYYDHRRRTLKRSDRPDDHDLLSRNNVDRA
jgi:glycosyltransferase involved in cell wall biosynthesis